MCIQVLDTLAKNLIYWVVINDKNNEKKDFKKVTTLYEQRGKSRYRVEGTERVHLGRGSSRQLGLRSISHRDFWQSSPPAP